MIHIRPLGSIYYDGFVVSGHANHAERGQDIVCASVSAITQMIAFELAYKGYGTCVMLEDEGTLIVRIDEDWDVVDPYLRMMIRALKELEDEYPDKIKVEGE